MRKGVGVVQLSVVARVKALYDYEAMDDGELSIKENDVINVLKMDSSDWWYAELHGKFGFISKDYVEIIKEETREEVEKPEIEKKKGGKDGRGKEQKEKKERKQEKQRAREKKERESAEKRCFDEAEKPGRAQMKAEYASKENEMKAQLAPKEQALKEKEKSLSRVEGSGSVGAASVSVGSASNGARSRTGLAAVDDSGMALVNLAIASDEIVKEKYLAEGGFGQVFLGQCRGQKVAIKELKVALTDKAMQEFKQESAMMVQLRHDNVVSLVGICIEPGNYCMVMPFMEKGALYGALHSGDRKLDDWGMKVQIALDMVQGLNFLHKHNPTILHRDLKSLNVLLDRKYAAKLADFGLSAVKTESSSQSKGEGAKKGVGTLRWKAPELFGLKPKYSTKSDIYALAMTLWELASRAVPYAEADDSDIKDEVKSGEREEIDGDWPEDFAETIKVCWKQKPEERPEADMVVKAMEAMAESAAFSEASGPPSAGTSPAIAMFSSQTSSGPADSGLPPAATKGPASPGIKMFTSAGE